MCGLSPQKIEDVGEVFSVYWARRMGGSVALLSLTANSVRTHQRNSRSGCRVGRHRILGYWDTLVDGCNLEEDDCD